MFYFLSASASEEQGDYEYIFFLSTAYALLLLETNPRSTVTAALVRACVGSWEYVSLACARKWPLAKSHV